MKLFGRKKSNPSTLNDENVLATERRYVSERVEERMTERQDKVLSEAKEKIRKETEKILAIPKNPKSLDYFLEIADYFGKRANEIQEFKRQGGKVVGTFCGFVPNEIINAADAIPIQLSCGFCEAVSPANDLLSDAGLCPLIRSSLGTKMTESSAYFEASDMIVNPTPCDAKLKMGEILQDFGPVVTMNVPRIKDSYSARKQWVQEVLNLKEKMEALVGKKISRKDLRRAIETYQEAQNVWRKFWDIRQRGNVIWGRQALLVSWLTYIDDIQRW
ncbi:MAG: 2-hydroxyacyl-CoA dehydratase, partial [Thermoplasmata archaeon]|nr:2-hydroxyacyl-CoA dehydratase [Thermoplasmata archaeon]